MNDAINKIGICKICWAPTSSRWNMWCDRCNREIHNRIVDAIDYWKKHLKKEWESSGHQIHNTISVRIWAGYLSFEIDSYIFLDFDKLLEERDKKRLKLKEHKQSKGAFPF